MNTNITVERRSIIRSVGASLCVAFSLAATMAAAPVTVPGAYGTAAIGDLSGMLDRVGTLASKVNPGITGDAIRGQLGMMLGDPGLSNMGKGAGIIAVMPKDGKPFLLIETAEGKAKDVVKSLKDKNMQAEEINGKLVAVSPDAAGLTEAKGEMGIAAAKALDGNDDKFLMLTVDVDTLVKDKGDDMRAGLKQMAAKSDEKSSASAGTLTFAGNMVTAIGKRTDTAQIKLDISSDGILYESSLFPVGGVTMGKPEGVTGAELLKSVPSPDSVLARYESYVDTQSVIGTVGNIMVESLDGTGIEPADKAGIEQMLKTGAEAFGDAVGGYSNLGKDGVEGAYVVSVLNADKAIQYVEESIKQINDGPMSKMYKAMDLKTSASVTKNAGTVDGQPYHTFSFSISGDAMKSMPGMGNYDGKFTIVNGDKMAITLGSASLEDLVKGVKAGSAASAKTVTATSKLPAGGFFYGDYDFGAMANAVKQQNAQAGAMIESLKGSPILEAGYADSDSIKMSVLIPAEVIIKGIAKMQQGMGAPAEKSDDDSKDSSPAPDKKPTE